MKHHVDLLLKSKQQYFKMCNLFQQYSMPFSSKYLREPVGRKILLCRKPWCNAFTKDTPEWKRVWLTHYKAFKQSAQMQTYWQHHKGFMRIICHWNKLGCWGELYLYEILNEYEGSTHMICINQIQAKFNFKANIMIFPPTLLKLSLNINILI